MLLKESQRIQSLISGLGQLQQVALSNDQLDTQGDPVGQNLVSCLFQICSLVDALGLSLCGLDTHSPLEIQESREARSGLVVRNVKRPGIAAEGGFLLPFQPALTQCLAVDQH